MSAVRFSAIAVEGKTQCHMGKVKPSKVSQLKPKKKCCRKKTRCVKCPVVIMRMRKLENNGASKKELKVGLKMARAA
ncbi:UNVERIFIED_ORG: hypothetical protein FNL38_10258 [Nocardia globerula]|uniref:Uncharacterized protein n=2 Tax=Nocardiaceae TaxID=85025 RepID=A0A652YS33_NOCGL|nr:hypothetical protein SZ00_04778 [Rhodococcus sp. AD45]PVX66901.1 hypothetical protein C8E04_4245 [Rhodococcus globerulus]